MLPCRTGGARVAQVDMYTLTSTAASLTVTLNDPTLVQRLLWLPSSGFALWSAEAEGPHAAAYRAYGPLLTTPPEAEGPHAAAYPGYGPLFTTPTEAEGAHAPAGVAQLAYARPTCATTSRTPCSGSGASSPTSRANSGEGRGHALVG